MNKRRRKFSRWLAATFPVFFLLHWNGLFDQTYYWALEYTGSTGRFVPQVTAALLSAVIIFAVLGRALRAHHEVLSSPRLAGLPATEFQASAARPIFTG